MIKAWEKFEWFVVQERMRRPGYARYLGLLIERWDVEVRPILHFHGSGTVHGRLLRYDEQA
jgi:hypothetical protein